MDTKNKGEKLERFQNEIGGDLKRNKMQTDIRFLNMDAEDKWIKNIIFSKVSKARWIQNFIPNQTVI